MSEKRTVPKKKTKLIMFDVTLLVLLVVVVLIIVTMSGKSKRYTAAIDAESAGNLNEAYLLYDSLGNFRDSRDRKQALEGKEPLLRFSLAKENDIVAFGSFEQDDNPENGAEPLEWLVLDARTDRVLLLSRDVIACMPYNDVNDYLNWEECSLRKWLNDEFMESAFSETDRALIKEVKNKNPGNSAFETDGGNDTLDSVFLLSPEEANAYFHEDDARMMNGRGKPTQQAIRQGISVSDKDEEDTVFSPWWLRGPGVYENSAAFVETDGTVYENGAIIDNAYFCGVRPALWVKTQ